MYQVDQLVLSVLSVQFQSFLSLPSLQVFLSDGENKKKTKTLISSRDLGKLLPCVIITVHQCISPLQDLSCSVIFNKYRWNEIYYCRYSEIMLSLPEGAKCYSACQQVH